MIRAVIEFLVMIGLALLARAILRSVLGGIARASTQAFSGQPQEPRRRTSETAERANATRQPFTGGDLHRDPVCGTYVAEASSVTRRAGGQTFYYCSESCRERHALAAR